MLIERLFQFLSEQSVLRSGLRLSTLHHENELAIFEQRD
jgi:hypothetical protein